MVHTFIFSIHAGLIGKANFEKQLSEKIHDFEEVNSVTEVTRTVSMCSCTNSIIFSVTCTFEKK